MTKGQLKALVNAITKTRDILTDEQAAEVPGLFKEWSETAVYAIGDRVVYNGILYKVLQAHTAQTAWNPIAAVSLFAQVLPGQDGTEIGEWIQPDSTNPYMQGDKVTHNDKTWESTIDNNVWEPGVYGWREVIE